MGDARSKNPANKNPLLHRVRLQPLKKKKKKNTPWGVAFLCTDESELKIFSSHTWYSTLGFELFHLVGIKRRRHVPLASEVLFMLRAPLFLITSRRKGRSLSSTKREKGVCIFSKYDSWNKKGVFVQPTHRRCISWKELQTAAICILFKHAGLWLLLAC